MALFGKKKPMVVEPPLDLKGRGGTDAENQQREITVRQAEAIVPTKELLYDALSKRVEKVVLDYTREAVAGRYLIDGLWHNIEPRDRESGDAILAVLKTLCGLNPQERRATQAGKFGVDHTVTRAKFLGELTSQGVKTGERVIIDLKPKKGKTLKTLGDLGMREQLQERVREHMKVHSGLVLISAPPGNGFTTLWNVVLNCTDRLLRDFSGLEDKDKHETTAENVNMTTFDGAAGETPERALHKLLLRQPDAVVVPDLCDGTTVNQLCEVATDPNEPKLIVAGVRAQDSCEALLRVLLLQADPALFAKAVTSVINTRLIRKLNDTCKQPYQPPPQLLAKLGIPPGRVKVLYGEWTPPPPPTPEEAKKKKPPLPPGACPLCEKEGPHCFGLGYRERTGIFEVLEMNDQLREVLIKQPKLEVLRNVARATGNRSLQEEGLLLVIQGTTSLKELQRVLKPA
jgi:type II secretory ATPase GspE/PulE/Tfp pilus assembly ATPase PilB-like protein